MIKCSESRVQALSLLYDLGQMPPRFCARAPSVKCGKDAMGYCTERPEKQAWHRMPLEGVWQGTELTSEGHSRAISVSTQK